jgi:hypothetical protein
MRAQPRRFCEDPPCEISSKLQKNLDKGKVPDLISANVPNITWRGTSHSEEVYRTTGQS